ncbi:MAG: metallophosphoesterase [Acidobacteria bacterium]|nr:metallophosphoesterase [Acidobacteriota bacterium]
MSDEMMPNDDAQTLHVVQVLGRKSHTINSLAWSPDGKTIATAGNDCTIWLWDVMTGNMKQILEGHMDWVMSVSWSPDGKWLASGGNDGKVKVWEVENGQVRHELEGHSGSVWSVSWSSEGKWLASGGSDGKVRVWEVETGKERQALEGHTASVWSVGWSPDGKWLASGGDDGKVKVWEVMTGKIRQDLEEYTRSVLTVSWSLDGQMVASGTVDGKLKVSEVMTGKMKQNLGGHLGSVWSVSWSPDGKCLASSGDDQKVRVWEVATGKMRQELGEHTSWVRSVSWSPDGKRLASGEFDQKVKVWEVATWKVKQEMKGHTDWMENVSWSPDGEWLASSGGDQKVRVWEVATGKVKKELDGHKDWMRSVSWSPDGEWLVTGGFDQKLRIWEAATGQIKQELEGHRDWARSVNWSPNGKWLVSGAGNGEVRVWEVATGKVKQELDRYPGSVLSLSWSPDGEWLAGGGAGGKVWVWEVATGKVRWTLEGFTDNVWNVNWSPDGTILIFAPFRGDVIIWNLGSEKLSSSIIARYPLDKPKYHSAGVFFFQGPDRQVSPVFDSEAGIIRHWKFDPKSLPLQAQATKTVVSTTAKVVLVGESRVGKSCLALQMAEKRYEEQDTTHGMKIWSLKPEDLCSEQVTPVDENREIVLWDLGGQDEYRLVHQLFLHDTSLALVLLDPIRGRDAFEEVEAWNVRLKKQLKGRSATKFLVGTKLDEPGTAIDRPGLNQLMHNGGFVEFYETSAKNGRGVPELCKALSEIIDWKAFTRVSRTVLFQTIRDEIQNHQQQGEVVLLYSDLEKRIQAKNLETFTPAAVNAVVEQMAAQGLIVDTRMVGGARVLVLQIDVVERYAGSLIFAARNNPRGLPALEIQQVALGKMNFPRLKESERLNPVQELTIVNCVVELLIEHGICLQHEGLLIFPALFPSVKAGDGEESPHSPSLKYGFTGAIGNIYSALIARLEYSDRFGRIRLWEDRAEFEKPGSGVCGVQKVVHKSGRACLDLFFSEQTPTEIRDLFTVFVEDHIRREGVEITEVQEIICSCGYRFDQDTVQEYVDADEIEIVCLRPKCRKPNRIGQRASKIRDTSPGIEKELSAIKTTIEKRSKAEVATYMQTSNRAQIEKEKQSSENPIRILHLSDIHVNPDTDPLSRLQPLMSDLRDKDEGLGTEQLDYLVISGDLTDKAQPEEFEKVHEFLSRLIEQFQLSAERCIIVPGNHDLSWFSGCYEWKDRRVVNVKALKPGSYKEQSDGYLVRVNDKYPHRFENFGKFYHQLVQKPYPTDATKQGLSFLFEEHGLQFLALNSASEIDEYFPERSSINEGALSKGLADADNQIKQAKKENRLAHDAEILRIAVWHHPVTTDKEPTMDAAFLERLQKEKFKLCLHGHVHEDCADLVRYLHPTRQLHIAGAGSFGAAKDQRPESMPRLYNLIEIERDHSLIRIHTRCMKKNLSAWEGWAVWPSDKPHEKRSYYEIRLK